MISAKYPCTPPQNRYNIGGGSKLLQMACKKPRNINDFGENHMTTAPGFTRPCKSETSLDRLHTSMEQLINILASREARENTDKSSKSMTAFVSTTFAPNGENASMPRLKKLQQSTRIKAMCRVSRDDLDTRNQRVAMERYFQQMSQKPAWQEFVGTSRKAEIPEILNLIKEIEAGLWDEVCFLRVDRSGRHTTMDCQLWDACVKAGCTLNYIDDRIISSNPDDRLRFVILSGIAEQERRNIIKRTLEGHARAVDDMVKRHPGWTKKKAHKAVFRGSKAGRWSNKILRRLPAIRGMLDQGCSYRQIVNKEGGSNDTIEKIAKLSDAEVKQIMASLAYKKATKLKSRVR